MAMYGRSPSIQGWRLWPSFSQTQKNSARTLLQAQDTWTILSGQGSYQIDAAGTSRPIGVGDVVVAYTGCVHGVYNNGPSRCASSLSWHLRKQVMNSCE
jgi:quercetin dioxygenase-like cupin family protein